MLHSLRIRNLVVVEQAEIEFSPGLNVLTGSTGAGKSLILGAMNLLLGQKATSDLIRPGADRAEVEAVFSDTPPHSKARHGTKPHTGTVRREVRQTGRSHAWIDGEPVTMKQLGAFCEQWIEPHGQNEQFRLKDPESHVEYLDTFADNRDLRGDVEEALAAYDERQVALRAFDRRIAALREKQELLEHRIGELERARLEEGEKDDLERQLAVMANAERIYEALSTVCAVLYDDDESAAATIAHATRKLGGIAGIDDRIDRVASEIESASVTLGDGVSELRSLMERLEFEPEDMARLQERLDVIVGLERRYGATADELVTMQAEWVQELDGLAFADSERDALLSSTHEAAVALGEKAARLSGSRRDAAAVLDKRMTKALEALMLRGARFRTEISLREDPSSEVLVGGTAANVNATGADDVRFMVRTNPGQAEGPLDRIASTGEISRIALALKELASDAQTGRVVVFDEIDAGIGADLGSVIAEKLLALTDRHQIICITHMPQIAARGHNHLVVVKESDAKQAAVVVGTVSDEARRREVARMLGGADGSDRRLALADELLRSETESSPRMRP